MSFRLRSLGQRLGLRFRIALSPQLTLNPLESAGLHGLLGPKNLDFGSTDFSGIGRIAAVGGASTQRTDFLIEIFQSLLRVRLTGHTFLGQSRAGAAGSHLLQQPQFATLNMLMRSQAT